LSGVGTKEELRGINLFLKVAGFPVLRIRQMDRKDDDTNLMVKTRKPKPGERYFASGQKK
jgi:hypothetical protein